MGQGSNSSTLRQYNERVVISAVRKAGVASKPDLARSIGLTLQSLTRIVDALEEKGLLEKSGRRSVGIGQPSNLYQIKADGLFSVGIKLGRQNIEYVLSDFAGQVIDKASHRYKEPTPEQLIDSLSSGIEVMLGKLAGHAMFQGEALERLKMCGDCRVVDIYSNPGESKITDL